MKHKVLLTSLFLFVTGILWAELPELEIIRVRQVAPGAVHTVLESSEKPWLIHVLEMDMNETALDLRAVDGNGLKKPSIMSTSLEGENYRLVGAINGDFFEPDYRSTNANIMDGQILKLEKLSDSSPTYWSAVSFNDDDKPVISCNRFTGTVKCSGNDYPISDVNETVSGDELAYYNSYKGTSTGFSGGVEVRIAPVTPWIVNDTVKCIIEARSLTGDMEIPDGKAVLSGGGAAGTYLNSIYSAGDTVSVFLGMQAFEDLAVSGVSYNYLSMLRPLKYLVGGFPMIVRNGENYGYEGYRNENGGGSFATDLHPRTALGVNEDTTKIIFAVVDGRQDASIGMSLIDLADIMIRFGAYRAMNFDGGGSSVMVVNGEVANTPSDGAERSVRNCIAMYSSAPEGELTRLQIELDTLNLYKGCTGSFRVSGWDDNYNPKTISDWSHVSLQMDRDMGDVTQNNGYYELTAGGQASDGYIYALYDGVAKDSLYLHIHLLDPVILDPESVMTDTSRYVDFTVRAVNENGDTIIVENSVFDFSVSDPQVGSISADGRFKGKASGSTFVYAAYGDEIDSSRVDVVLGEGEVSLDLMDDITGWSLSGENLDMDSTGLSVITREDAVNGQSAVKLDYKTTDNGKIYLNKTLPVPGIPENILLDFKGDGENHRVYVDLEDADGEIFTVYQSGYVNFADEYRTLTMSMEGIDPVYPVTIKDIYIKLKKGILSGSLFMDDLRITYPGHTSVKEKLSEIPQGFILKAVYPNPFNPRLTFDYELSRDAFVTLSVYNLTGHKIAQICDEYQGAGNYSLNWEPENISSGCYFYRLKVNDRVQTGKCVLMK